MILNNNQVDKIIDDFLSENEYLEDVFTYQDYEDVKYVYNKIKNAKQQTSKSYDELESLITFIAGGVSRGENLETLIETHLDSKGTFSANIFLGEGERDNIDEALSDNGLSPDIFKGMQWVSDFDSGNIKTDKGIVNVDYKVDTSSGSPIPQSLTITLNGKEIYKWENESDINYAKEYKEKRLLNEKEFANKLTRNVSWLKSADKQYNEIKETEEAKFENYKYELKDTQRDVNGDKRLKEKVLLSNGRYAWIDLITKKFTKAPKD